MRKIFILILILHFTQLCKAQDIKLYTALEQINAKAVIKKGLTGKGVKIGIIDAGFEGISTWKVLSQINESGQIKFKENYVPDSITGLYKGNHGAWVLGYVGGREDNYIEGLATNAEYYLARNEYGSKDYRVEEIYLEQALDTMYNMGVRLVNISSGYTDKYADKKEKYKPSDMDGKTTYISKVCEKYAKKGMIIIVTAGNEGDYFDFWKRYISAPADAENVISVGATHFSLFNPDLNGKYLLKASYAGTGPEFLPYIKPDVACFSDRGCSFSTPIITGLVATMLEMDSTLNLKQIKDILHKSSTLYPYPNNYIGYGVPDAEKVLRLLENPNTELKFAERVSTSKKSYTLTMESENIVIFYKKNEFQVIKQVKKKSKNGKLKINRKRCVRTTVVIDSITVYEIFWN